MRRVIISAGGEEFLESERRIAEALRVALRVEMSRLSMRYRLMAPIAHGGMGKVSKALDRLTGQTVALKQVLLGVQSGRRGDSRPDMDVTLPSLEQAAPATRRIDGRAKPRGALPMTTLEQEQQRLSLAQEFRTLAALRHPNIISVLDYGFDDEHQPFFTMELLAEASPLATIAKGAPLSVQIELICQVLRALSYLHRHGVIHRDVKPANILAVPLREADGWRVKVLDFGLAEKVRGSRSVAGTPAYMAPELFAGRRASVASDLYAVAMMAAEFFLGKHPFTIARTESELIQQLQAERPNLSLLPNATLAAVLDRALAKLPSERPADAATFMRELAAAGGVELPPDSSEVRDSYLVAAPFIGRELEFGRLTAALNRARVGQGSAWLILGESGVGKSRLLDELRSLALVNGVLVIRGQAVASAVSSYQLWREVLRLLALLTDPSELELSVLGTLLPELAALLERQLPPPVELDAEATQNRLQRVLFELVTRKLAQPVLLLLEDLHWADAESLALLRDVTSSVGSRKLMVVGSARDDEAFATSRELPNLTRLRLPCLSAASLQLLCELMLGRNGLEPALLELLQRESEGNTYFIIEVVRALAEESGSLEGIMHKSPPAHLLVGGVQEILRRRLARVPHEARPLLRLAAVAGRELDMELLSHIWPDAHKLVQAASEVGVLTVIDQRWRFSHDKLHEYLSSELAATEKRNLHALIADTLVNTMGAARERFAIAAHHYLQAERFADAAHYYALAGEAALLRGALFEAEALLEQATQLHERTTRPLIEQLRVWRGLTQTYYALRRQRKIDAALRTILALCGEPVPARRSGRLIEIGKQLGKQLALRLRKSVHNSPSDVEKRLRMREVITALAASRSYLWLGPAELGILTLLHRMNLVEEFDFADERIEIYLGLAVVLALTPLQALTQRCLRQAEAELQHHIGTQREVEFLTTQAFVYNTQGAWHQSLTKTEAAITRLQQLGDEHRVQHQLGELLFQSLYSRPTSALWPIHKELEQRAAKTESRFYACIAQVGQSLLLLRGNDVAGAAQLLEAAYLYTQKEHMPVLRTNTAGLLAECVLTLGERKRAKELADEVLVHIKRVPLTLPGIQLGLCGAIEVYLAVAAQTQRIPQELWTALLYLSRLAAHVHLVMPAWLRCCARTLCVTELPQLAVRCLTYGRKQARRMGLIREEALASYFLFQIANRRDGAKFVHETAATLRDAAHFGFTQLEDQFYLAKMKTESP